MQKRMTTIICAAIILMLSGCTTQEAETVDVLSETRSPAVQAENDASDSSGEEKVYMEQMESVRPTIPSPAEEQSNAIEQKEANTEVECTPNPEDIIHSYRTKTEFLEEEKVDLSYIEKEMNVFDFFFYDPINDKLLIQDDTYGALLNLSPYWASIRLAEKSYYTDLHPKIDLLKNGKHKVNVYKDGILISGGQLIYTPEKYRNQDSGRDIQYAIKLNDENLELDAGYYVIISDRWDAIPRPIALQQDEKTTTFIADLNNNQEMVEIQIEKERDEPYSMTKWSLSIDGKCFYDSIAHIYDGSFEYDEGGFYTEEELNTLIVFQMGFLNIYDIDGDGQFEFISYRVGDGGDSFTVERYASEKIYRLFWWLDEEEPLPFTEEPSYPFLKESVIEQ